MSSDVRHAAATIAAVAADSTGARRARRVLLLPPSLLPAGSDQRGVLEREAIDLRETASVAEAAALLAAGWPDVLVFSAGLSRAALEPLRGVLGQRTDRGEPPACALIMVTELLGVAPLAPTGLPLDAHLISPLNAEQLARTLAAVLDLRLRRAPRVTTDLLAALECAEPDHPTLKAHGLIVDLSAVGARVESSHPLTPSGRVRLIFVLDGRRVDLQARVVHEVDELALRYALEFEPPAPSLQRVLVTYLERHLRAPAPGEPEAVR